MKFHAQAGGSSRPTQHAKRGDQTQSRILLNGVQTAVGLVEELVSVLLPCEEAGKE
jgi:hypothetical protein